MPAIAGARPPSAAAAPSSSDRIMIPVAWRTPFVLAKHVAAGDMAELVGESRPGTSLAFSAEVNRPLLR